MTSLVNSHDNIKKDSINLLQITFPKVPKHFLMDYFNYLEKYCELKNGNKLIPLEIFGDFRLDAHCSANWIRSKITVFLNKHKKDYKLMKKREILIRLLGIKEYNSALDLFSTDSNDEDNISLGKTSNDKFKFEDVDGGSRKTKRRRLKRKTLKTRRQSCK